MKKYLKLLAFATSFSSYAQSDAVLVQQTQDFMVAYNSTLELEQAIDFPRSLLVTVPAKPVPQKLFGQVLFVAKSNESLAQHLFLRDANASSRLTLSTLPVLIKEMPASTSSRTLVFDLGVLPQTRWIQPGSYSFIIKFSTVSL